MIRCVETGRNPTMRYLGRTHRCSVAWLHERFSGKDISLVYELTSRMCADIYTKAFTDASKWQDACWLINVVDPALIKNFFDNSAEHSNEKMQQQPQPHNSGNKNISSKPVPKQKTATPATNKGGGTPRRDVRDQCSSATPAKTTKTTMTLEPFKRDMLLGFVRNLTLNPAPRRVGVDRPGETADLGVAVVKGIVKSETLNGNASQFLSYLHQMVKEMMGDSFTWNAVRIERGRKAK